MGFEFKINGQPASAESLRKMSAPINPEDISAEDQEDMAMSMAALKRMKEMKGEKLPSFLEEQKSRIENSLGAEGIARVAQKEDSIAMNAGLDKLEEMKKAKQEAKEESEKEKTKICANCGKESPMSANFCGSCGEKFEENSESEKTKICSQCGKENGVGSNFCGYCGSKFEQESNIQESDMSESKTEEMGANEFLQAGEIEKAQDIPEEASTKEELAENNEDRVGAAEQEVGIKEYQSVEDQLQTIGDNKEELLNFLGTTEGIQGSGKFYNSEELKGIVGKAFEDLKNINPGDKEGTLKILSTVTRTGGLREKVNRIFLLDNIRKM
jgi:ribosomal protein L40E